ncbi:hypothetical protein HRbin41_00293 [bacterium HR41]|nr:hypothetical protein HRbin41_00293 [bacterium HR41]
MTAAVSQEGVVRIAGEGSLRVHSGRRRVRGGGLRKTTLAIAVALAAGAGVASGAADGARTSQRAATLSVMTRNIYLGGDIAKPIPARTREEFEAKATELWNVVRRTDFPTRARLLAREVRRYRPDVIGLQEVALWRRGPTGVKDGSATPARTVVYDYLALLLRELARAKLRYRVAAVQREADIEAPTSLGYDVRLTMRDVVLVRRRTGLRVVRKFGRNYNARLVVPTAVGTFTALRGYAGVDLALGRQRVRVVNTHLEAFLDQTRVAQAQELAARGGPLRTSLPLIVVGDLNSDPRGDNPGAYRVLQSFGLRDTWVLRHGSKPANSCCLAREDLSDPTPAAFDHHIDHILVKPRTRVLAQVVVGTDPRNRSRSGLWPSDHGGHVAVVQLPRR